MKEELALRLLWLGVEDSSGLWEAAHEVAAVESTVSFAQACMRASDLLQELHRLGFIWAYSGREPIDTAVLEPLTSEEFARELRRDESWVAPENPGDISVRYDTSEAGFGWYRERRGWRQ